MWNDIAWTWELGISNTVALAAVAVIGYLFGRKSSNPGEKPAQSEDVARATAIAQQLEGIAGGLRNDLAYHRTQVEKFKKSLRTASTEEESEAWRRLRDEAEAMLGPTLELVGQLSTAYEKIRQQSQALTHYTGSRTDPLTGLCNGKALEEQLEIMLHSRPPKDHASVCSVAMLSIAGMLPQDKNAGPPLEKLGKALERQLRGSDFAARYGTDELVIVMAKTPLSGACVFGRRLRATMEVQLGLQICCGLAEALPGETAQALLSRADAALYSARATSPGAQYLHNGAAIRADQAAATTTIEASAEPAEEPSDQAAEAIGR